MTETVELTDAELNRRIAQALGYRVEFHEHTSRFVDTPYDPHTEGDKPGYVFLRPDWTYEREMEGGDEFPSGHDTDEQAWKEGMEGVWRWASNVGAAMGLLDGLPWCAGVPVRFAEFKPKPAKPFFCGIHYGIDEKAGLYQIEIRVEADTVSRAIAECWLAWKETQDER